MLQTVDAAGPAELAEAVRAVLAKRQPAAEASDGATPAGVLVPLQYHDGRWHVILNVRSDTVGEHRGEISFPGGHLEAIDADMVACALRETREEMGVRPEDVDVLGPLDAMLTRTNYIVWPTVGIIPHPYPFAPDAREVAAIVEVPVSDLLDPANIRHEARLQPDGSVSKRVSFVAGEHLIFGVTAWILAQLLDVLGQARLAKVAGGPP